MLLKISELASKIDQLIINLKIKFTDSSVECGPLNVMHGHDFIIWEKNSLEGV